MSYEPYRPNGLSDEEWNQVQGMRSQRAALDYLAEETARRNDRYARDREQEWIDAWKKKRPIPRWMWLLVLYFLAVVFATLGARDEAGVFVAVVVAIILTGILWIITETWHASRHAYLEREREAQRRRNMAHGNPGDEILQRFLAGKPK